MMNASGMRIYFYGSKGVINPLPALFKVVVVK